jgi:hypothetical protein
LEPAADGLTFVFEVGDIALCKVAGNEYLHLVKTIRSGRYQIGNNPGSSMAGSDLSTFTASA